MQDSKLKFEILAQSATGGKLEASKEIISNKIDLKELFIQVNQTISPKATIPKIDFKLETIAVLFMGEKNTGGFSIIVKDIISNEHQIIIKYTEQTPLPTDMVTMAITQPYCIVKFKNKESKEIVFIKE
jgi:hypothetical protein